MSYSDKYARGREGKSPEFGDVPRPGVRYGTYLVITLAAAILAIALLFGHTCKEDCMGLLFTNSGGDDILCMLIPIFIILLFVMILLLSWSRLEHAIRAELVQVNTAAIAILLASTIPPFSFAPSLCTMISRALPTAAEGLIAFCIIAALLITEGVMYMRHTRKKHVQIHETNQHMNKRSILFFIMLMTAMAKVAYTLSSISLYFQFKPPIEAGRYVIQKASETGFVSRLVILLAIAMIISAIVIRVRQRKLRDEFRLPRRSFMTKTPAAAHPEPVSSEPAIHRESSVGRWFRAVGHSILYFWYDVGQFMRRALSATGRIPGKIWKRIDSTVNAVFDWIRMIRIFSSITEGLKQTGSEVKSLILRIGTGIAVAVIWTINLVPRTGRWISSLFRHRTHQYDNADNDISDDDSDLRVPVPDRINLKIPKCSADTIGVLSKITQTKQQLINKLEERKTQSMESIRQNNLDIQDVRGAIKKKRKEFKSLVKDLNQIARSSQFLRKDTVQEELSSTGNEEIEELLEQADKQIEQGKEDMVNLNAEIEELLSMEKGILVQKEETEKHLRQYIRLIKTAKQDMKHDRRLRKTYNG